MCVCFDLRFELLLWEEVVSGFVVNFCHSRDKSGEQGKVVGCTIIYAYLNNIYISSFILNFYNIYFNKYEIVSLNEMSVLLTMIL